MADLGVLGTGWIAEAARAAAPGSGWHLRDARPQDAEVLLVVDGGAADTGAVVDRLRRGAPTLVGPPLAPSPAAADAVVRAAEAGGGLAAYAEPLMYSPFVRAAASHRRGVGPARLLTVDLTGRPDGSGAAPLVDLAPAALALLAVLLPPCEPRTLRVSGEEDLEIEVGATGGLRATAALDAGGEVPSWSAQVASDHGVARVELLPGPAVESQGLDVTPSPSGDSVDPALEALGVVALLDDLARVRVGRGGRICPLGFGRRIVELLAALTVARASGTEVPLPYTGDRDLDVRGR